MKKIKILDKEFSYSVIQWDSAVVTEFYQGTEINSYKRFIFFGKIINEVVPKLMFSVCFDIENPCLSGYGLIAQPKMVDREIQVKFVTSQNFQKVKKYLEKIGIAKRSR